MSRPTPDDLWSALAKEAWRRGEAATDPADARRWLDRAHRLAPHNGTVALSLALACLRNGDAAQAQALFSDLATRFDLAEAWLGLAASALRRGAVPAAVAAMQAVLSRHAASAAAAGLAAAVVDAAGLVGWCAADGAGRLHADGPAVLVLDGAGIAPEWQGSSCLLPPGHSIAVTRGGVALLGSPIDLAGMEAMEGLVTAAPGGLSGWAWHPRNPDRPPLLRIDGRPVVAQDAAVAVDFARPLARPRLVPFTPQMAPGPMTVRSASGRMLPGSPVDPGLRRFDGLGPTVPAVLPARRLVDVVIPVHGGMAVTLACLHSVLPSLPPGARLHVVDDAGPDPALLAVLQGMAADGRIVLHRCAEAGGFPIAANIGLRACAGRDVVLLNNDTVVPPGWLEALADAAYRAPDIGTACPLSNDASILSYPDRAGGNPVPDPGPLAALAVRANGADTVDIPVGVGFCLFIRHDCLAATGVLREDAFAQGYGEEVDWCLRAGQGGWRHVAVPGCFVAHRGGASFGNARHHLQARNAAVVTWLHPGFDAAVAAWIARDPLQPARRRMDALRWQAGCRPTAVVLVSHAGGGGVDRVVAARAAALRAAGHRAVVIHPDGDSTAVGDADMPNLRFRLPAEWPALLDLLRHDGVRTVELHHALGHAPALLELAQRLGAGLEVFVHDYASFCARISLVQRSRYCGEPAVEGCAACVAAHGSNLAEPIAPHALVARSAALFAAADRVVAPSADTAARLRRHFPAVRPVVEPLEDDAAIPAPPVPAGPVRHLCVVGAIGVEKGYEVLLACVEDAAARALPLRFTVVGFTADDARLLRAGPVFVTGPFAAAEAVALIRQQAADLAFLPSIWPETWCFALGEAWRAGLRTAVFDIGAPAERVRRTGWGHVLPLGLPPAAINDWLLRSAAAVGTQPHV